MKKKQKINWNSSTNQNIKGQLVSREVEANLNSLVNECFEKGVLLIDEIENGYTKETGTEEQQPVEVLEWWLVSEWFYDKLKAKGEAVLSYAGFNYFWGRTCSGQAILLDNVISSIAEDMEILEGMANDWSK